MLEADGLSGLVADLAKAPLRAQLGSVAVIKTASKHMEETARTFASGIGHAPHYPRAITHDVTIGPGVVTGEVGPDKARTQGALGNILEYGTGHSAPIAHLGPALDVEGPLVEKPLAELAEKSIFG